MPLSRLSLPAQTLFADLETRAQDAEFLEAFPEDGAFLKRQRNNQFYWYYQRREGEKVRQTYVGRVADPAIAATIERFQRIKDDYRERRDMVRSLREFGLPQTDSTTGAVVAALARAGFFRLRGVLVGTTAFQCYAGMLGVILPNVMLRTGDADLAQYFAISQQIDDAIPPILDVLRAADPSFRAMPSQVGSDLTTSFANDSAYKVEFLTPNRGSDDFEGAPVLMPALGGAAATPLRFLDFLIREPVRSVLLHEAGVPVVVPAPERYAIHKLILAARRKSEGRAKIDKDLRQAEALIEAMSERRGFDLCAAWSEAWDRGPRWRACLIEGSAGLSSEANAMLREAIVANAKKLKRDPESVWPTDQLG